MFTFSCYVNWQNIKIIFLFGPRGSNSTIMQCRNFSCVDTIEIILQKSSLYLWLRFHSRCFFSLKNKMLEEPVKKKHLSGSEKRKKRLEQQNKRDDLLKKTQNLFQLGFSRQSIKTQPSPGTFTASASQTTSMVADTERFLACVLNRLTKIKNHLLLPVPRKVGPRPRSNYYTKTQYTWEQNIRMTSAYGKISPTKYKTFGVLEILTNVNTLRVIFLLQADNTSIANDIFPINVFFVNI